MLRLGFGRLAFTTIRYLLILSAQTHEDSLCAAYHFTTTQPLPPQPWQGTGLGSAPDSTQPLPSHTGHFCAKPRPVL